MRREVGEVQKVGFASSSRNPLSVSTTDLRLKDKCRGNTLALQIETLKETFDSYKIDVFKGILSQINLEFSDNNSNCDLTRTLS